MKIIHSLSVAIIVVLADADGNCIDVATKDGLSLGLSETGCIDSIRFHDKSLPMLERRHPLRVLEYQPDAKITNLVPNADFEAGDGGAAAWMGPAPTATRSTEMNHTPGGKFCGKITAPAEAGPGNPLSSGALRCANIPATPGATYILRGWGLTPTGNSGGNVFVIELDKNGRALTDNGMNVQHNLGWQSAARDQWVRLQSSFKTRPDCVQFYVYANIWKGFGTFFFDDIEVFDADCLWRTIQLSHGNLEGDGSRGWRQKLSAADDLEVDVRHAALENHILIETAIRDAHHPPRPRALRVSYTLPLNAAGWTWHDDGRRHRAIAPGPHPCENSFPLGPGPVSLYPFTSIGRDDVGLSLGAPMDRPRVQDFTCDAEHGYATTVCIGLSPHTQRIGPASASFATVLFGHDGEWGMRAAAEKFYQIFPAHFIKRSSRDGVWLYAVPFHTIVHPEDFGFAFYEGWFQNAEHRAALRKHDIGLFPYTEPWGARQSFPAARAASELPPYEERLAQLEDWANDKQATAKFLGGPRWEVARAILNSMPFDKDGRAHFQVDLYGSWAHWWMTNPSPLLPEPNRATTCRRYEVDPFLSEADGIYLDSLSEWLGKRLNFRREHLACATIPPAFDPATAQPALPDILSWHEFIDWLASDLHANGKLVQMNIFPNCYRFFAHLGDVLGSEVGWTRGKRSLSDVESDAVSLMRRMLAFQKPTSNLLQEGDFHSPRPELPSSEIEAYIQHQMFYGFFPGIATIGGEEKAGYAGWKRYFGTPSQYERDRGLFKKYIPVIKSLCAAGWQPVTFATTSCDEALVERFGSLKENNLHLTLRNDGARERSFDLRILASRLGAAPADLPLLAATEMVSGSPIRLSIDAENGAVKTTLSLRSKQTAVLRLGRAP